MLQAIGNAHTKVQLEMYIFTHCSLGFRFLNMLIDASKRGVAVQVLLDSFGCFYLADSFWQPLRQQGGTVKWFNPIDLHRWGIRNHRKLLVCDRQIAFVGGYNIAAEYEGDGVTKGWCDIGIKVQGSVAQELSNSYQQMFDLADFKHKRFARVRKPTLPKPDAEADPTVLTSGPGRGMKYFGKHVLQEMKLSTSARIIAAYFLPTWRIRRGTETNRHFRWQSRTYTRRQIGCRIITTCLQAALPRHA